MTGCLADSSRIIAVHHEDVPDADAFHPDPSKPYASNSLAHIATTLIAIKSSQAIRQDQEDLRKGIVSNKEFSYLTVHGNEWDSAVCEVEHKRKSGKVAREVSYGPLGFEPRRPHNYHTTDTKWILDQCVPPWIADRRRCCCECLGCGGRHARYRQAGSRGVTNSKSFFQCWPNLISLIGADQFLYLTHFSSLCYLGGSCSEPFLQLESHRRAATGQEPHCLTLFEDSRYHIDAFWTKMSSRTICIDECILLLFWKL